MFSGLIISLVGSKKTLIQKTLDKSLLDGSSIYMRADDVPRSLKISRKPIIINAIAINPKLERFLLFFFFDHISGYEWNQR